MNSAPPLSNPIYMWRYKKMKYCTGCLKNKKLTEFGKDKCAKDGHSYQCKLCISAYNRKYYKTNLGKMREKSRRTTKAYYKRNPHYLYNYNVQRNYNMEKPYIEMLADQDGCCMLCGKHESEFKRRLAVDHDHVTGKVRALLCRRCNTNKVGSNTLKSSLAVTEYLKKFE